MLSNKFENVWSIGEKHQGAVMRSAKADAAHTEAAGSKPKPWDLFCIEFSCPVENICLLAAAPLWYISWQILGLAV